MKEVHHEMDAKIIFHRVHCERWISSGCIHRLQATFIKRVIFVLSDFLVSAFVVTEMPENFRFSKSTNIGYGAKTFDKIWIEAAARGVWAVICFGFGA